MGKMNWKKAVQSNTIHLRDRQHEDRERERELRQSHVDTTKKYPKKHSSQFETLLKRYVKND